MFFFFIFLLIMIVAFVTAYSTLSTRINDLNKRINSLNFKIPNIDKGINADTVNEIPVQMNIPRENISKIDTKISGEEKGGRFLGKIGILAILLALAFFLKDIPDQGKVIIGLIIGVIFIGIGFYIREKYRKYAHILMGGGIALLYLTVFAATSVFNMIDSSIGFSLMIFITIISVIISIIENAISLATLSSLGGFLTPILISSGENNYISLFTYLLILDIGILGVSYKKKWPSLYHIGFWGTGILFFIWCSNYFESKFLSVSMIFLTLYFLIFLISSIFHHIIRKEKTKNSDIFGICANAVLYFSMGLSLLRFEYTDNLGYFAFILAVVYSIFAYTSYKTMKEDKILNYLLTGISVVFLSITMPLQFSGTWITFSWLIESLVLYIMAFYIPNNALRKFGLAVFILGIYRIAVYEHFAFKMDNSPDIIAFLNINFLMIVIAIIVAYIIQNLYSKFEDNNILSIKKTIVCFIFIANLLTIIAITSQIHLFYQNKLDFLREDFSLNEQEYYSYRGDNSAYSDDLYRIHTKYSNDYHSNKNKLENQRNTSISVFWVIYAILLISFGFIKKAKLLRILGLVFFIVTALKIFFDVWSLGTQYRVISLVVFGVLALFGSFGYAKYKDKITEQNI